MKKLIAMMLVLAALASLFVMPVSAASEKETLQQAAVETALAYFRKGALVQYDWANMTRQNRFDYGTSRMTTGDAPEKASQDYIVQTNCSDWMADIYLNAFNYAPTGSMRYNQVNYFITRKTASDPDVVMYYNTPSGTPPTAEKKGLLDAARKALEPGDIISVMIPEGGHSMLYVGDYLGDGNEYIIHSTGDGSNYITGKDSVHKNGTIRRDKVDILFDESSTSTFSLRRSEAYQISVVRPANVLKLSDMTPAAKARLKYSLMDVDRSASTSLYTSVENGETITVTIKITNNSKSTYQNLVVTEPAPAGGTIVAGSATQSGTITASGVTWNLNIPAGSTKTLTYRVKVTAPRGGTLLLPAGAVDTLPSRELSFTVSGKEPDAGKISSTANSVYSSGEFKASRDLEFANAFYKKAFGVNLGIPSTMNDLISRMFTVEPFIGVSYINHGSLLVPKAYEDLPSDLKKLSAMILPDHLGGQSVYLPVQEDIGHPYGRVVNYLESNYEPGDVFLCLGNGSRLEALDLSGVEVYIYLGGSRVATQNSDGSLSIRTFDATIDKLLRMEIMICLRPSLAFDNINDAKTTVAFADVPAGEWYAEFVNDLAFRGVVNGMNATTFDPSGKLTVGQALKLLAVGLGYGEQSPTGSHWASGYLTLANTECWVNSETLKAYSNLDSPISRLTFCQIAAKAAGLSEQPASNPFTDTADKAVLALNKAGVINGMTATTFDPEGRLTRSQIAKIICLLSSLPERTRSAAVKPAEVLPDKANVVVTHSGDPDAAYYFEGLSNAVIRWAVAKLPGTTTITVKNAVPFVDESINDSFVYYIPGNKSQWYGGDPDANPLVIDLGGNALRYSGSSNLFFMGGGNVTIRNGVIAFYGNPKNNPKTRDAYASDNSSAGHLIQLGHYTGQVADWAGKDPYTMKLTLDNVELYTLSSGGGTVVNSYLFRPEITVKDSVLWTNKLTALQFKTSSQQNEKSKLDMEGATAYTGSFTGSVTVTGSVIGSGSTYPVDTQLSNLALSVKDSTLVSGNGIQLSSAVQQNLRTNGQSASQKASWSRTLLNGTVAKGTGFAYGTGGK